MINKENTRVINENSMKQDTTHNLPETKDD